MFYLKSAFLFPPTYAEQLWLQGQSQKSVTDINLGNFKHCYFPSFKVA